jgi:6-pyruvoyltetrahydropterin/6-carboxytetrahydropterin synthase
MIYVTRRVDFCASHRLFNPNYSDEKNEAIYGNCSNLNGHGHNYILDVTIKGDIDPETGMVIELNTLKKLIKTEVADFMDHKNLNLDVGFLEDVNPTVENLAVKIWDRLESKIPNGTLHEIKLFETERNFAVYRG